MKQTRLGRTELQVSRIGFGGLQISTKMDYPAAERLLNAALDAGISILDTAAAYGDSEERIGRAISHRRSEYVIATKSGGGTRQSFMESLDRSLHLLRTDYVDIYQFHGPGPGSEEYIFRGEALIECMRQAQQQGKIRFIGFSSHSVDAALSLAQSGAFDVAQYPISYVGSEAAERGLVEAIAKLDLGFLGMKPFGGGRLGEARYCLGYVFQFPSVVPLIGFESEEELREAVQLAETGVELTTVDQVEMTNIKADLGEKFCRGCCYCEPCPQGISIWNVMFLQVFQKQFGEDWLAKDEYRQHIESVSKCEECGQCMAKCPFGLEIPSVMREMVDRYYQVIK